MKLSVIVPMYNAEKYLAECLDSLDAQTFTDMEVIIVDDGCVDHSCEIAETYVKKNPRKFRLVHKELGNLGEARNFGMPFVKGEYLTFLDSDDFIEPALYEKMVSLMEQGNDIAVTDIEYWWIDPSRRYVMKGITDWDADTMQKKALLSPMFSWNKMYKAKDFGAGGLTYPTDLYYEDVPVTSLIFAKAGKVGYLNEALMHYRQREDSMLGNRSNPRVGEIFNTMSRIREWFDENDLSDIYHDELEYLHIEHLRLYGMFRFIRGARWSEWYDMSENVMKEFYPDWKKNRYIKNLSFKNRMFLKFYNRFTAPVFKKLVH